MPFLRLETGVNFDLTITKEEVEKREGHWINGKRFDCGGAVCQYCTAEFIKKTEYLIEVKHGDADVTLTLPGVAYDMLKAFGSPILGKRITVCRSGTGTNTRYNVTSPDTVALPSQAAPGVTPAKPTANLSVVATTLRQMADEIDEWLGNARFG